MRRYLFSREDVEKATVASPEQMDAMSRAIDELVQKCVAMQRVGLCAEGSLPRQDGERWLVDLCGLPWKHRGPCSWAVR